MEGPPESAYAGGAFALHLDVPAGYPAAPPRARFATPLRHHNVNRHGRVCHSLFDRNWTADATLTRALHAVFGLLLVPEFSDPVDAVITLDFHWDEVRFREEVAEHVRRHASKGRAEWRRELVGE